MALLILIGITGAIVAFRLYTNKFYNPYTLTLIYGKKGCGKSTIAQKLIYKHYKRGWHIYYNEGDSRFKAGTAVDASKLWTYEYKPHSLIIIDEVNLLWDNRQFKTFPKELAAWFRLQRHYKVKVILFSQTADADKKIRDLTDRVYLCKRHWQVLICCVPYEKEIVYLEPKKKATCPVSSTGMKKGLSAPSAACSAGCRNGLRPMTVSRTFHCKEVRRMLNGIITLIMALGLMLTGAVTVIAKCLEIGAKSAQAVSSQDKPNSQDN